MKKYLFFEWRCYSVNIYLRNKHHISVKSSQTQSLRNIGYYHGFKGYRFVREDRNRINFSSLNKVIALNNMICS